MRRIAAQRLLLAATGELLSRHAVEMDGEGEVIRWYPFSGEIAHTEWLNGLLVLAPAQITLLPEETFEAFRRRIAGNFSASAPLRAYLMTPFNAADLERVGQSRVMPL